MDADVPQRAAGRRVARVPQQGNGATPGEFVREHPAVIVSGLYLFATAVGMFFSWAYLRHFGINVFLYAEISDFLLASFKDPVIWAVVFVMLFAWYFDVRASKRWGSRERARGLRWYGTRTYRRLSYPAALFALVVFLSMAAGNEAEDARKGFGDIVNVSLADSESGRTGVLLETTARFVFLFDPDTQMVYVHPHESIAEISFIAPNEEP